MSWLRLNSNRERGGREGGESEERERKRRTRAYGCKVRKSEVGRPSPMHVWAGTHVRMENTLVDQAFDIKIPPSRTHSTKF